MCLNCRHERRMLAADAPCPECGESPPATDAVVLVGSQHLTSPFWTLKSALIVVLCGVVTSIPWLIAWTLGRASGPRGVAILSWWALAPVGAITLLLAMLMCGRARLLRVKSVWVFDVAGVRRHGRFRRALYSHADYDDVTLVGRDLRFKPRGRRVQEWFLRADAPESAMAAIAGQIAALRGAAEWNRDLRADALDPTPRRACLRCGGLRSLAFMGACPACSTPTRCVAIVSGRRGRRSGLRLSLTNGFVLFGSGAALLATAVVLVLVGVSIVKFLLGSLPAKGATSGLKAGVFIAAAIPPLLMAFRKHWRYVRSAEDYRDTFWEVHETSLVACDERRRIVVPLRDVLEIRLGPTIKGWRQVHLLTVTERVEVPPMWVFNQDAQSQHGLARLRLFVSLCQTEIPRKQEPQQVER